jgi:fatty-acyl-CoA synthase
MTDRALSYVAGTASVPLIGETLGACLTRVAAEYPEQAAFVSRHQQIRYSYRDLDTAVDRVAAGLIALRVNAGDRVGIWSTNCLEWVLTQYAAARIGALFVTMNPRYRQPELEHALRIAGVSVLVVGDGMGADAAASRAGLLSAESRGRVPLLEHVVFVGSGVEDEGLRWSDLLAMGAGVADESIRVRQDSCQFDDPVAILFTSGTTGAPKGATLSHHTVVNCGFFMGERLGYGPDDRICVPVPFYHCLGCVMANVAALTHASAVVLPAAGFEPLTCLEAIAAEGCTALYGVPTMFIELLGHPALARTCCDSLRTGIMAGAPCPIDLMRQVIARLHLPELTICYGMTETPPVTQSLRDDPVEDRVSTVGTVHPHVECKIIDPQTGRVVERNVPGELCARGYGVMQGYWNDPKATHATIDATGWIHTGDLASMRDDGHVQIVGRTKDMVIRGGENIMPTEIEEAIRAHENVRDVYVVGVPDPDYGEELCACVKLREGTAATPQDIRKHCRLQLAPYKVPRHVLFRSAFPMTLTGKVQKFRLRELAIDELGLGV